MAICLALLMVLSLAACGSGSSGSAAPAAPAATAAPTAPAAAPAEAPAAVDSNLIAKTSDGFPSKEITLIVPSDAGAEDDNTIRMFAKVAEQHTGVKFLVQNEGGASGVDAMTALLKADTDGYTMLTQSTSVAVQIGAGQTPYTKDDFYPLAGMHGGADCIIVKGDSPYQTLEDLVNDAKANPGKLNWGAAKAIGVHSAFTMMVMHDAEIEVNYVAYDKAKDAVVGVLNGDVQVGSVSFGQIQDDFNTGNIRILATSDSEHNKLYPDVPLLSDYGYMTADGYSIYRGWFLKPGVPQEHIDYLNEVILAVQNDAEWQEYVETVVAKDNLYMDTETFTTWFNNIIDFVQTYMV